jgi:hypothetical protein
MPVSIWCLPWGLVPLRDTNVWSPQSAGAPTLQLSSVYSVSHALDGLLLLTRCRLISSYSHVPGSHFKGFPCYPADSPHRRVVPSCRCPQSPASELPHQCQILQPRLQGVNPGSNPLPFARALTRTTARSPLVVSHSRGFISSHFEDAITPSPLTTSTVKRSQCF